jgi:hypothetical protein
MRRLTRSIGTGFTLVTLAVALTGCWPFASTGIRRPLPKSVSAHIAAATGGSLTHPGGATLTIPAHALSADATVTLTDGGRATHVNGDPLDNVSDAFSVSATGAGGKPVQLTAPATMSISPDADAGAHALELVMAEADPGSDGAIAIHHVAAGGGSTGGGGSPAPGGAVKQAYTVLTSAMWVMKIPILTQQPTETSILQVPWYDQNGLPWCVPTSITESMRYYNFHEQTDILNNVFGETTALANWQVAGRNSQPARSGAGYGEFDRIGVPTNAASGTDPQVRVYQWDDDFVFNQDGQESSSDYRAFQAYVTLVNTGLFGLVDRRPLTMDVDAWWHSVVIVGVDGNGLYIHDSNINDPSNMRKSIGEYFTWSDFQNAARSYKDKAQKVENKHTIWTAVAYNLPVKPLADRTGSIVIDQGDVSFVDSGGYPVTLQWDGAAPHGWGYYFSDTEPTLHFDDSELGPPAPRTVALNYQYRIANITNVPETYTTVAEVSGPGYGTALVSQTHTVSVPAYSLSSYISGSLHEPPSGNMAYFSVKLFEVGSTSALQDVKFVKYNVADPQGPPVVSITVPQPGQHVFAGWTVSLVGSAYDPNTGKDLSSTIRWSVNSTSIGTGPSTSTSFSVPGTYTITATASNAVGLTGSATTSLIVDPAPPTPSVTIDAPADGTAYSVGGGTTYVSVNLAASGSPGMTFLWSDSIQGDLGHGANLSNVKLYASNMYNCGPPTVHVITLTGTDNYGHTATAHITLYLDPICIQ